MMLDVCAKSPGHRSSSAALRVHGTDGHTDRLMDGDTDNITSTANARGKNLSYDFCSYCIVLHDYIVLYLLYCYQYSRVGIRTTLIITTARKNKYVIQKYSIILFK